VVPLIVATFCAACDPAADARPPPQPRVTVLVDTLAGADPGEPFRFGGGALTGHVMGTDVFGPYQLGFEVTVTQATVISEVGAFVTCELSQSCGLPQFVGEIRSAASGRPGPEVLATLTLSDDGDPLAASYERAAPGVLLTPGSYFVVLGTTSGEGFIIGGQYDADNEGLVYAAGFPPSFGDFRPRTGEWSTFSPSELGAAVRVLGIPVTTPSGEADCKHGGWRNLSDDRGQPFRSQGQCVSFVVARQG
jgi:hypothetical protein